MREDALIRLEHGSGGAQDEGEMVCVSAVMLSRDGGLTWTYGGEVQGMKPEGAR